MKSFTSSFKSQATQAMLLGNLDDWNTDFAARVREAKEAGRVRSFEYPDIQVGALTTKGKRRFEPKRRSDANHAEKRGVAMDRIDDQLPKE